MRKIYIIPLLYLLVFLVTGFHQNLSAQENSGGFAGSFSRMGFSPRGMAMGNAMTAVVQEGSYSYYNPALAAHKSDLTQIDAGTASLPFDRRLNMVHSHFQLPPSAGLSVSLLHGRVGSIDGRDQNGYHTGHLSTNEFQIIGNFALRFSDTFWGGIGLKYNLARYHPEMPTTSGLGVDAGILLKPASKMRIGISVQDLLASYRFNTSDLYGNDSANNQQMFPLRILAGFSYEISEEWIVSLDVEHRRHTFEYLPSANDEPDNQDEATNREESSFSNNFIRAGTSYRLHERFTFRAGTQLGDLGEGNHFQPSAGFSIHLPYDSLSPSIDYAFVREPSGLSTMHVFAIRLNL